MNAPTSRLKRTEPLCPTTKEPSSHVVVVRLALSIRDLMADEGEEGQVALAWAVLNRMRRFGTNGGSEGGSGGESGGGASMAAVFCEPGFLRALAIACLIMSGDIADPTDGATHFHRHDEEPAWAWAARPKALIGWHLFYEVESAAVFAAAMCRGGHA